MRCGTSREVKELAEPHSTDPEVKAKTNKKKLRLRWRGVSEEAIQNLHYERWLKPFPMK